MISTPDNVLQGHIRRALQVGGGKACGRGGGVGMTEVFVKYGGIMLAILGTKGWWLVLKLLREVIGEPVRNTKST